jgi:hypothetical protein
MSSNKKEAMFAKLVAQQPKPAEEIPLVATNAAVEEDVPPPAPLSPAKPRATAGKPKPQSSMGKRVDPDYCQANAYVPKTLRKAVDKALLDIDGLDYSSLVTDLLRKWIKSRGVSE